MFQACIDRLDAIVVSGGSLGIPGRIFIDDNDLYERKSQRFVLKIRTVLDIPSLLNQPRKLFHKVRYQWLDRVVEKYIDDWTGNLERMSRILISDLSRVVYEKCDKDLETLYFMWILTSITKALALRGLHDDFIYFDREHGFVDLCRYMCLDKILSTLVDVSKWHSFIDNHGETRYMDGDESDVFIKDFMAYIQLVLHKDEIDEAVIKLPYNKRFILEGLGF